MKETFQSESKKAHKKKSLKDTFYVLNVDN